MKLDDLMLRMEQFDKHQGYVLSTAAQDAEQYRSIVVDLLLDIRSLLYLIERHGRTNGGTDAE